jgi:hypothetical protein
MNHQPEPIPEWHHVDEHLFRTEIQARYRPAVLRGLVGDWPAVRHARQSPRAVCDYLKAFDSGADVNAILMPPGANGRVGYSDDLRGFTFVRNRLPISQVIDQLQRYLGAPNAPALAAQSAMISEAIPGFLAENRLPLLDPAILPRIWLGNNVVVPAHFDEAHNLACCVSGRRRFTLFPPEQAANLYIGPLDFTPAGAPVSLPSGRPADFDAWPRYRDALAAAMVAELEPGDALYIPALWWHQVESVGLLNILVNYWWGGAIGTAERAQSPSNCLMHCLLNMRQLDPAVKQAWKAIFNHFVFGEADPAAHLPPHARGILGDLPPEAAARIRDALVTQLQKQEFE